MKSYYSIPDDLVACLRVFDEIMKVPSDLGSLEKIQADLQKLEDPLMVAVVGCFSAGKSTLINALVGAKVCKTGIRPVTMKLSHIPYQNGDRIQLIDTMGVDAMDFPEHKEETADAIANADAVIYAVNAGNLGTNGDGFIGDTLGACKTPGILVVTHWDHVEEDEDQTAVCQAAQKLANAFFPQQKQTPMFFINAKIAESQNALKQDVVPSNNRDFAKLEKCIQTKLADKDNKQRMKISNILQNLASAVQKRVDHLTQECKELEQKNWVSEYEMVDKQFKEKSVTKEIRFQNQKLVSAQEHLTDLQKMRGSAIEDCNERLREAAKDAAEAGAGSGFLNGALLGAGAGSLSAPGIGTAIGALVGGLGGLFKGDREKKHLEGIVQRRLDKKQEAEKTWNCLVESQEKVVKDLNQELQKLKKQEKQLEVKRDEAKAKVAEQQEEAQKVRQRCLMLIRRFEQHLHTIREHLKDHKCL